MDRQKSRGGKSQRGKAKKWEDQRGEQERRKKMQVREKVGKSRFTKFFQWFVAPEGRQVGSLKRHVRSHLAKWEMKIAGRCGAKYISKSKCTKHTILRPLLEVAMSKKCTPLWREPHIQVKCGKHVSSRPLLEVEMSKECTPLWREPRIQVKMWEARQLDHFWKLRCRKSARRCGANHISKSTCAKHFSSRPLLEVEMLKKCTPLLREAHFQVKILETPHARTTLWYSDVEKSAR